MRYLIITVRTHNREIYVREAGPYADFVREMVESGRYESAAEVVLAALELLRDEELTRAAKHEWLKREIQKGIDSGPGRSADEVFASVRSLIRAK